nr:unnamed protein product [Callosobruchus chinensis]
MHEDTPPLSEDEQQRGGRHITPENKYKISDRKRYARNRKTRSRENKNKNELIKKLQLKVQKYKQRYHRLKIKKAKRDPLSPRDRVSQIMDGDKKVVAKKLLFAEVMSDQLKENYGMLKNVKQKQIFRNIVTGRVMKKYRLKHSIKTIVRGSNISENERKDAFQPCTKRKSDLQKVNAIWRFLENDFHSKMCLGKKDYCRKNKTIKQKRYLCDTMRNLHKEFSICHPEIPVSYSFWCKNRPFWIVPRKITSRDTCGCTCCFNMALLVQSLQRMEVFAEGNVSDVIGAFCCEQKTAKCLLRERMQCKENNIIYKPYETTQIGHFFKWTTKKECFLTKNLKQRSYIKPLREIIIEFEASVTKFLKHKGRSLHQHIQISRKKADLKQNEIMIHMDFSENYSLKYAEETQAFHFGGSRQQICLHTVVIYFKHDAPAIWAHLQPVLTYISEFHTADTLIFVSDSPATQYRNKTMFYFLATKLHQLYPKVKECSWNYWESGHGKGAPDGVGGVTKRTADRLVSEGKYICSYEILLTSLQNNIKNVTFFSIDDKDIAKISDFIKKGNIKPCVDTMQVHQVRIDDCTTGLLKIINIKFI